jgi:hypothetical protein
MEARSVDDLCGTPEFGSRAAAAPNVLERDPDSGGLAYWVSRLDAGKISRGGVMVQFSEGSEFKRKSGTQCDQVGVTLRMLRRSPPRPNSPRGRVCLLGRSPRRS